MDKKYDIDVIRSMAIFIVAGLYPGSFAEACILQDRVRAYKMAHALLKIEHAGQDIIANMLEFVEQHFPRTLLDNTDLMSEWPSHGGLLNVDYKVKMQMYLECGHDPWFLKLINPEFLDYIWQDNANFPKVNVPFWRKFPRD
jgi:hypothetical protein